MSIRGLPKYVQKHYEVHEWKHASAILRTDFPGEWDDIIQVLSDFTVMHSHIIVGGKERSQVTKLLDNAFRSAGWRERMWHTKIIVDEDSIESPTHKVDCVKNRVALEIEWSNKDPFFDRDLNNFRLLFDLRAVSVGVIITKSDELAELFKGIMVAGKSGKPEPLYKKYGRSTTWMSKLIPRIEGGGGGGCPILAFGIRRSLYVENR